MKGISIIVAIFLASIGLVAAAGTAPSCSDNSIVICQHLNNNSMIGENSTKTVDSGPQSINGTISGGATWNASGGILGDGALSFNGSSQYVNFGSTGVSQNYTAITINIWVNPSGFTNSNPARFVDKQNQFLDYATNNTGSVCTDTGSLSDNTICANTNLTPTVWQMYTFVYNGTSKKVYLNGVLKNTEATTGAIAPSAQPLYIGGRGGTGFYFSGQLDEFIIWNVSKTDAQIANIYNNYIGVECTNFPTGSPCNITQQTNWTGVNASFPLGIQSSSSTLAVLRSFINFTGAASFSNIASDTSNYFFNNSVITGNSTAFSLTNNVQLNAANTTFQFFNSLSCTNAGGVFNLLNVNILNTVSEGIFYNGCHDLNLTNVFLRNFSGTGGLRYRNADRLYVNNVSCLNGADTCVNVLPSVNRISQNITVLNSSAINNTDYGFACKFCNNFYFYNLYVERNVVGYGIDIYGASTNGTVANSTVINVQGVGIAFSEDNIRLGRNLSSVNNTVRNASTCLYYNDVVNFYSDNDKLYDCRQRGFSVASNATNGNVSNMLISNATLDSIKVFDSDNLTIWNVTVLHPNNTLYVANFRNLTIINGWNNDSFDYQTQVRSGVSNLNFTNVSGYSFFIDSYASGDFNLSGQRAIFNASIAPVAISFSGLSNALVFNENGSVACLNIDLCDGALNVTIPVNNRSIILNNFNVTEGITRKMSPISISGSRNARAITSLLADTVQNVTLVLNISEITPSAPRLLHPNGSSETLYYSAANGSISVIVSALPSGSSQLVLDSGLPNITVTGPENGTSDRDGEVNFTYTVTGNVSSCSLLYANGSIIQTTNNVSASSQNSFLASGVFSDHPLALNPLRWMVSCTDIAGNGVNSSVWDIVTYTGPVQGSGTGDSPGGSSSGGSGSTGGGSSGSTSSGSSTGPSSTSQPTGVRTLSLVNSQQESAPRVKILNTDGDVLPGKELHATVALNLTRASPPHVGILEYTIVTKDGNLYPAAKLELLEGIYTKTLSYPVPETAPLGPYRLRVTWTVSGASPVSDEEAFHIGNPPAVPVWAWVAIGIVGAALGLWLLIMLASAIGGLFS